MLALHLQEHFIKRVLQLQPSGLSGKHFCPDHTERSSTEKAKRGTSCSMGTVFLFIFPDNNRNYIFCNCIDSHRCLASTLIYFCIMLPMLSFSFWWSNAEFGELCSVWIQHQFPDYLAVYQENYGFKSYPTVYFEKLLGDKDILFYHETFQDIQI